MKKIVRIGLIATIISSLLLTGCKSNNDILKKASDDNELKPVELSMYVFGDQPKDTPLVLEELNKLTMRDLNCTVKITSISWNDWPTKYNLLLASGEPIDLIYTSSWAGFNDQVEKGAFLPLNDLLEKYAPQTMKNIPKQDWAQAKYKGEIYAVPNTAATFDPWGIVVRKDLRTKYNLPAINSLDSFDRYLNAVKQNENEIIPLDVGSGDVAIQELLYASQNWEDLSEENDLAINASEEDIRNPFIIADTPEFLDFAKKMKSWADKGYWSKNVLSSKIPASENFKQGKSAATIEHFMSTQDLAVAGLHSNPSYEIEYFPLTRINNITHQDSVMQNAMAIPRNAANPERALMLLDKLRNDPEYYRLTVYGIEGKHYKVLEENRIKLLEDSNNYPSDQFSWGWRNSSLELKPENPKWDQFDNFYKEFKTIATPDKLMNFQLDKEPIRLEISAVSQVNTQYLPMIYFGIGDPVSNVEKYRRQLKVAGIDKILNEAKKQLKVYADKNELN